MQENNSIFHLEYNRWLIEVQPLNSPTSIFNVRFKNEIPDITIEKIMSVDGTINWRSVSDDMNEMAREIGVLIEEHYQLQT
jgi:hypothetical protein